jgi:hypothetical protein
MQRGDYGDRSSHDDVWAKTDTEFSTVGRIKSTSEEEHFVFLAWSRKCGSHLSPEISVIWRPKETTKDRWRLSHVPVLGHL